MSNGWVPFSCFSFRVQELCMLSLVLLVTPVLLSKNVCCEKGLLLVSDPNMIITRVIKKKKFHPRWLQDGNVSRSFRMSFSLSTTLSHCKVKWLDNYWMFIQYYGPNRMNPSKQWCLLKFNWAPPISRSEFPLVLHSSWWETSLKLMVEFFLAFAELWD